MIDKIKEVIYYLYKWVLSFLSDSKKEPILYSKDYFLGTLYLYKYNYPGVVDWSSFLVSQQGYKTGKINQSPAVWVFVPHKGDYKYVGILLNIATYKATKNTEYTLPKDWAEVFEKKLNAHITNSRRATHLFIDLWISKEKISFKRDKNNKTIPCHKIFTKNALLLDMQGYREFAPSGDVFAKKIFIEYIYKLCSLKFSKIGMSWEKFAQSIDARQWLNTIGASYLGEDHITVRN